MMITTLSKNELNQASYVVNSKKKILGRQKSTPPVFFSELPSNIPNLFRFINQGKDELLLLRLRSE